jgi:hypothetical protein
LGAKKRAKMEMKAEKKAMREVKLILKKSSPVLSKIFSTRLSNGRERIKRKMKLKRKPRDRRILWKEKQKKRNTEKWSAKLKKRRSEKSTKSI